MGRARRRVSGRERRRSGRWSGAAAEILGAAYGHGGAAADWVRHPRDADAGCGPRRTCCGWEISVLVHHHHYHHYRHHNHRLHHINHHHSISRKASTVGQTIIRLLLSQRNETFQDEKSLSSSSYQSKDVVEHRHLVLSLGNGLHQQRTRGWRRWLANFFDRHLILILRSPLKHVWKLFNVGKKVMIGLYIIAAN